MKRRALGLYAAGLIMVSASIAGCAPKDDGLGVAMTDCQLAAHNEIDGTSQDDANRQAKLGDLVNACLKGKGFKPASDKPGCLVENKTQEGGHSFVKASADCWQK